MSDEQKTSEQVKNLTKEERLYRATMGVLEVVERGEETLSPKMAGIIRAMLKNCRPEQWNLDMEAAPKDGTRLLLLIDGVAETGGFDNHWSGNCWVYENVRIGVGRIPTKWMHLPPE